MQFSSIAGGGPARCPRRSAFTEGVTRSWGEYTLSDESLSNLQTVMSIHGQHGI
jgi:hypothetical protein